jgi:hypothetical protein
MVFLFFCRTAALFWQLCILIYRITRKGQPPQWQHRNPKYGQYTVEILHRVAVISARNQLTVTVAMASSSLAFMGLCDLIEVDDNMQFIEICLDHLKVSLYRAGSPSLVPDWMTP